MIALLAVFAVIALSMANGANDNFKGVATLYGSGSTSYRVSLIWATLTTALGSLTAVSLARQLLSRFSGKGIVPDSMVEQGGFAVSVSLAASITVFAATRLGFPVSTTHALIGAMVGTGLASRVDVNWSNLASSLIAPLLISPVVAALGVLILYPLFRRIRWALGIGKETCLCAGQEVLELVPLSNSAAAMSRAQQLSISLGTTVSCREHYAGRLLWLRARDVLDAAHFLSAGFVSFARGLNDTPKIAALLLAGSSFGPLAATTMCGTAMALGGVVGTRRIAESMSHRITDMNAGQGVTANIVTAILVTGASSLAMPVSTTHVSCGALFAIAGLSGGGHWKFIRTILSAWITTAPLAALLGALIHFHFLVPRD